MRVPENPMSANNLRYATVADTKQGWNIMPFPCNCKEPALPAQEDIIKENKVDCQSHGVCKYLTEILSTNEFTGKQYMALYEIKDYFKNIPNCVRVGQFLFLKVWQHRVRRRKRTGMERIRIIPMDSLEQF